MSWDRPSHSSPLPNSNTPPQTVKVDAERHQVHSFLWQMEKLKTEGSTNGIQKPNIALTSDGAPAALSTVSPFRRGKDSRAKQRSPRSAEMPQDLCQDFFQYSQNHKGVNGEKGRRQRVYIATANYSSHSPVIRSLSMTGK